MTAFFDKADRRVRDLSRGTKDNPGAFVAGVQVIEREVVGVVLKAISDSEFPDELRQEAYKIVATHATFALESTALVGASYQSKRFGASDEAVEYVQSVRSSRLLSALHSLFHKVASSRAQTRFGTLSDDPSGIVRRAKAHDEEVELDKTLDRLDRLVEQTRIELETADPETVTDLLHWARSAEASLKQGLEDDPGEPEEHGPNGPGLEVYCTVCSGNQVQSTFWVCHRTGQIKDHFTDYHETSTGGVWCEDCQKHTPLAVRKKGALKAGDRLEIPEGAVIPATYIRHYRGVGREDGGRRPQDVAPGRYVVRDASFNMEPDYAPDEGCGVLIAAADWGEDGKLSFNSSKHYYLIAPPHREAILKERVS